MTGRAKGSKNNATIEREHRSALIQTLRQIALDETASADARAIAAATLLKLEGTDQITRGDVTSSRTIRSPSV